MKQLHFNMANSSTSWRNSISKWRNIAICTAIGLTGLFSGCSNDDEKPGKEAEETPETGKISLQLISGTSQQGRIKTVAGTKALRKSDRLTYVGTITAPQVATDNHWSATAIAFNGNNAYITWHSDRQASTEATKWGGAVDVIDIQSQDAPSLKTTAVSDSMKFNHVLVYDTKLFLAATHSQTSGAIARIPLSNGEITSSIAEYIGFPGVSVNAVAPYKDGQLIAVSGHSMGTYATFAPTVEAGPYYYGPNKDKMKTQQEKIKILSQNETLDEDGLKTALKNFGGKYVTADENENIYVLYNKPGENAKIQKVSDATVIDLGTTLKSEGKYAETYDFNTGTWIMVGDKQEYYGKHVFAVKGGYAYVACGKNGLRVFNITNGNETENNEVEGNNTQTTGVCIDGNYLYAASGAGLRVYEIKENGQILLYAFEVETYDETTGKPTTKDPAKTGPETDRHSPNFVAVNNGYIYIANGQSGVRVYKFTEEAPAEGN